PYRKAVEQVKRRVEAGLKGEAFQTSVEDPGPPPAPTAALGNKAPDFVATDLISKQTVRLQPLFGKPVIIAFYSPTSNNEKEVLRFLQAVATRRGPAVHVLAFAVSEDVEQVRKQRGEMKLTYPILYGKGLHLAYKVEATPKMYVIDPSG